jgi:hypothetical protein
MRNISKIFFVMYAFISCQQGEMTEEQLVNYIADPDNGLRHEVLQGEILLDVNYKPATLVMSETIRSAESEEERATLKSTYDTLDYFVVRLSRNGHEIENDFAGNEQRFEELMQHLTFGIRDDFKVITSNDTIPPLEVLYTRAFGTAGFTSLLLVVPAHLKNCNDEAVLIYNDSWLGTGITEFKFRCNDIKNCPNVKI